MYTEASSILLSQFQNSPHPIPQNNLWAIENILTLWMLIILKWIKVWLIR